MTTKATIDTARIRNLEFVRTSYVSKDFCVSVGDLLDEIDRLTAELSEAKAELERVRDERDFLLKCATNFYEGEYPNPRNLSEGKAKGMCIHGQFRHEECSQCTDEYWERAMNTHKALYRPQPTESGEVG